MLLLTQKALNFEYQNDHVQAAEIYKKILESYPSNIYALKQLSKIYLHLKDLGNAYIYTNKAIKIDANEPKLW
jgi:tetratricopeptide (TPR) repeat protein